MTLTYRLGNALYINLTNKCTNACSFCIRLGGDTVGDSGSLWLEREPDKEEVLADIFRRDLSEFQELVFCGYGEPMMRLDDLVWIAAQVKRKAPNLPIRVNTNGQAELFYGPDAASRLQGVVDAVSISLNAPDEERYLEVTSPIFGPGSFQSMLEFALDCKRFVPNVLFTVVDVISPQEIERCRALAQEMDIPLRVREYIKEY